MAGTDDTAIPDGPEPMNEREKAETPAAKVAGEERERGPEREPDPEPEPEAEPGPAGDPEDDPGTRKAPPSAYGGLRVHAVRAAPFRRSGEVRPSPGPSPSAWS
jgi:hypothetical protein